MYTYVATTSLGWNTEFWRLYWMQDVLAFVGLYQCTHICALDEGHERPKRCAFNTTIKTWYSTLVKLWLRIHIHVVWEIHVLVVINLQLACTTYPLTCSKHGLVECNQVSRSEDHTAPLPCQHSGIETSTFAGLHSRYQECGGSFKM